MKRRELIKLGFPEGPVMKIALETAAAAAGSGLSKQELRDKIRLLPQDPQGFVGDRIFGPLAEAYIEALDSGARFEPRSEPAPYRIWGSGFEAEALRQMENACLLPVSVSGALMPDAHVGYGLPIGGVLATEGAVAPYAVGMDIACRMKMTVLDLPPETLTRRAAELKKALEEETRFGSGATFKKRREHEVMDEDWNVSPVTAAQKDKAWGQLGTSGGGNHFVEFGLLEIFSSDLGPEPGTYLALLSHSGSRGTGALLAQHYSKLARKLHPELPKELAHLGWLDLDSEPGREYWSAMELMGRYAAANHQLIHHFINRRLGARVILDVENHHNFAWREIHDDREVVVHRKGATPARRGVLGVIPGSMGSPGYIVRGLGGDGSLDSASHGAGRRMSRKAALSSFTRRQVKQFLEERNVTLISGGVDEAPMAYKDIDEVMAAQKDLVESLARFMPRLVKMAPAGS